MALLTRPNLHAEIDVRFPDNDKQLITPPIVRAFLHNLVDSALLAASDKLSLSKTLTLTKAQALLATTPATVEAGQYYAITGNWNATGVSSTVYMHGLSTSAYELEGVLLASGQYARVRVDVVAGTAVPVVVDAYTKDESNALAAIAAQVAASATDAQKQRIDAILAGADGSVDTFIEVFNRFVKDENAAAAVLATLQTHTDQLALKAPLASPAFTGQPAAPTPDARDISEHLATTRFVSTALATKGSASVQQQHTDQLATLGAQGAPAMSYLADGTTVGFASLDAALADKRTKVFMRFNVSTLTVGASNTTSGWPNYLDASGSTVVVNNGVTLSIPGDSADSLLIANFFFYLPSARGTGIINLLSTAANATGEGQYAELLNGYSKVPIRLNGGTFAVVNGYYASFTGTGTLYLYGNAQIDQVAAGITVRRSSGAGGKLYDGPGSATDGAMTQKATTDALAKKGNRTLRWPSLFSEITLVELVGGGINTLTAYGAHAFTSDLRVNLPASFASEGVASLIYLRAAAACAVTFVTGRLDAHASVTLTAGEWRIIRGDLQDGTSTEWTTVLRGNVLASEAGGAAGPWPSFTNPQQDDQKGIFRATAPAFFRTGELEYTLNGGAATATVGEAMRVGDLVSVLNVGGKAAGQVGFRTRTGGGRQAGAWVFNLSDIGGSNFVSYSIQETNGAIRVSGPFTGYGSAVAYEGSLSYNTGLGAWYEVTVPAGCTRVVFEGYKDSSSSNNVTATVNGNTVGTGNMYTPGSPVKETYFEFTAVVSGDVLRLTNAANNGGGLLIDQITFY